MSLVLDASFLGERDKEYVKTLWARTQEDPTLQAFWSWFFQFLRGYSPLDKDSHDWVKTTREKLHNSLNTTRKQPLTAQAEGKQDEARIIPLLQEHLRASLPAEYSVNVRNISGDGGGGDILCCFVCPDQRVVRVGIELRRWVGGVTTEQINRFKVKVKQWSLINSEIHLGILCTLGTITGCKGTTVLRQDALHNYLYLSQIPECERVHVLTTFLVAYLQQNSTPLTIEDDDLLKGTSIVKEVVERNEVEICGLRERLVHLEETNETLKRGLRQHFHTVIDARKKRKR